MLINNKQYRTIWLHPEDPGKVQTFDQRKLPFKVEIVDISSPAEACEAIRSMLVRGAPLIGATGAFGLYLAAFHAPSSGGAEFSSTISYWHDRLTKARPTAVNLQRAVDRVF